MYNTYMHTHIEHYYYRVSKPYKNVKWNKVKLYNFNNE